MKEDKDGCTAYWLVVIIVTIVITIYAWIKSGEFRFGYIICGFLNGIVLAALWAYLASR